MKSSVVIGLLTAVFGLLVDQGTKSIVVANAEDLRTGIDVFTGFNLIYLRNYGVSFGLFGGAPWWSLVVLALGICIWLVVMMVRTNSRLEAIACGAIIGGALGNVVDRLRLGGVTDFLDFYIGSVHWPAFNLADVFVVGGVGLLLLASWLGPRRQDEP